MDEFALKDHLRLTIELVDLQHSGEMEALLGTDIHALTATDA
jgi:hypothetical protein